MSIQIGAKPDSGFDDPIGMLKDCHRRIERFLDILCLVAQRAHDRALNAEEREAVEASLRYFRESGPRHNSDEEDSLFPRLRDRGAAAVLDDVARLEEEHQQAATMHAEVEQLYTAWIASHSLSSPDAARLVALIAQLQQLYRSHIQIEEDIVFPRAAQLLDRGTLDAMGAEFKARRD